MKWVLKFFGHKTATLGPTLLSVRVVCTVSIATSYLVAASLQHRELV